MDDELGEIEGLWKASRVNQWHPLQAHSFIRQQQRLTQNTLLGKKSVDLAKNVEIWNEESTARKQACFFVIGFQSDFLVIESSGNFLTFLSLGDNFCRRFCLSATHFSR